MIRASDSLFLQILGWSRSDKSDFERGYTLGYTNANLHLLEPWQYTYIRNVQRRFAQEETA